jgi:hypothetical protein
MTMPGALLGWLIASAVGLAFHLARGGNFGRLLLYLFASWTGFFTGHFFAEFLGWQLLRVGPINLFASLLGAFVALLVAGLLAGPERKGRAAERISMGRHDTGSDE